MWRYLKNLIEKEIRMKTLVYHNRCLKVKNTHQEDELL